MPAQQETPKPVEEKIDNWGPVRGLLIMCAVMGGMAIVGFIITQAASWMAK
jgi:hypothetical protein